MKLCLWWSLLVLIILVRAAPADEVAVPTKDVAMYSSHRCIGGHAYKTEDAALERRCVFYNVCHREGEGDVIHYFVNDEMPHPFITVHDYELDYDFRNTVYLGNFKKLTTLWGPKVTSGRVPVNFAWDSAQRSVLFQSWHESNPGHFHDLMLSIWSLQQVFNYTPTMDVRLLDYSGNLAALKHRKELLVGLSKHIPFKLNHTGNMCFRKLFVGAGRFSVINSQSITSLIAQPMLDFVLRNLNYTWMQGNKEPKITKHRVVILKKSATMPLNQTNIYERMSGYRSENDKNHVENHDRLLLYLRNAFGNFADVVELEGQTMSWETQIFLLRSATVIVAPPGGVAFVALYKRKHAALVVLDKNYHKGTVREVSAFGGSDDNFWTHASAAYPYINFPICNFNESNGDIIVNELRMWYVLVTAMQAVEVERVLSRDIREEFTIHYAWPKANAAAKRKEEAMNMSKSSRFHFPHKFNVCKHHRKLKPLRLDQVAS